MIEFAKAHYLEIAASLVGIYLLIKVKKMARKVVGVIFSLAAIARVVMMLSNLHH